MQGGCEVKGLCVEVDDAQSGDQSVGLESDLDGKGEVRGSANTVSIAQEKSSTMLNDNEVTSRKTDNRAQGEVLEAKI